MTRESELMLYALLGIPAILIGAMLLFMGPIGWFLGIFLGIAVIGAAAMRDDTEDSSPTRVNCPHCGARTSPEGPCDYCDEPVGDAS